MSTSTRAPAGGMPNAGLGENSMVCVSVMVPHPPARTRSTIIATRAMRLRADGLASASQSRVPTMIAGNAASRAPDLIRTITPRCERRPRLAVAAVPHSRSVASASRRGLPPLDRPPAVGQAIQTLDELEQIRALGLRSVERALRVKPADGRALLQRSMASARQGAARVAARAAHARRRARRRARLCVRGPRGPRSSAVRDRAS